MADKYLNYQHLASSEIEGQDYAIRYSDRETRTLILSPHAGSIEPGTSEITLAIAGDDMSFYLFEGIKKSGNQDLHITSTNFDEPQALSLVAKSELVVAIHGMKSNSEKIYLGGRDYELRNHVEQSLENAGFETAEDDNPDLYGISTKNICNRCTTAAGVQLELGKGLRRRFFRSLRSHGRHYPTDDLVQFANAIRKGLTNGNAFQ